MQSEFDLNDLVREAQVRWLKPAEVHFIIQNCDDHHLLPESAKKPPSGSLFLYNKRVLRNFRKDGHSWRKKRDGRTVGEAHERLKVGNVETLNCYYAHGEDNPNFQRRSFWMLSGERGHIVLVQYLDVANQSPGSVSQPSYLFSSPSSLSPSLSAATYPESFSISGGYESHINLSSPASAEISSEVGTEKSMAEHYNSLGGNSETSTAYDTEVNQALRRLEEQLSLNNDNLNEISSLNSQGGELNSSNFENCGMDIINQGRLLLDGLNFTAHGSGYVGAQDGFSNSLLREAGASGMLQQQTTTYEEPGKAKNDVSWTEIVDFDEGEDLSDGFQDAYPLNTDNFEGPLFPSFTNTQHSNLSYQDKLFDTDQTLLQPQTYSNLTIAQNQKFTIREVSPEWGYSFETTKVLIVGSFLCHPSEHAWTCMFGDIEVPIQIIQDGVIVCEAPPHPSGRVTLCITSANRESCSEVREFEYHNKAGSCTECSTRHVETNMSSEELLLLVRLSKLLLCDSLEQRGDGRDQGTFGQGNSNEDSWSLIVESLLVGSGTFASTMNWLLQEFVKDKMVKWLSSRTREQSRESSCLLSRKEQGIIHLIAGLGYEWALTPILSSGVSINFRDINGWTALHWAARFGREKMVASLIASGALAGAVTDPNAQDPVGKNPASIAAINGHKGLAGYLSEVALTSHLSSLKLQESELSEGLAVLEAEHTVNCISENNMYTSEDHLSMKDTLTAVRNAASAAARIQSAYRAHSFRKRQQKKAYNSISIDDYGFSSDDVQGMTALSRLAFRNTRDHNSAALSIQKKYRGYKGRKDFLDFRQKVVKIQAHVRGHQTRKNYYKVCWAVGILEKVVLRWRRKGVGLRGFKPEPETIYESDEEDFAKVFRKKKVEAAVEEAVSRVLSMVESPEAQQQYRRMLERYRQAKAQLRSAAKEDASASLTGASMADNNHTQPGLFGVDYY